MMHTKSTLIVALSYIVVLTCTSCAIASSYSGYGKSDNLTERLNYLQRKQNDEQNKLLDRLNEMKANEEADLNSRLEYMQRKINESQAEMLARLENVDIQKMIRQEREQKLYDKLKEFDITFSEFFELGRLKIGDKYEFLETEIENRYELLKERFDLREFIINCIWALIISFVVFKVIEFLSLNRESISMLVGLKNNYGGAVMKYKNNNGVNELVGNTSSGLDLAMKHARNQTGILDSIAGRINVGVVAKTQEVVIKKAAEVEVAKNEAMAKIIDSGTKVLAAQTSNNLQAVALVDSAFRRDDTETTAEAVYLEGQIRIRSLKNTINALDDDYNSDRESKNLDLELKRIEVEDIRENNKLNREQRKKKIENQPPTIIEVQKELTPEAQRAYETVHAIYGNAHFEMTKQKAKNDVVIDAVKFRGRFRQEVIKEVEEEINKMEKEMLRGRDWNEALPEEKELFTFLANIMRREVAALFDKE